MGFVFEVALDGECTLILKHTIIGYSPGDQRIPNNEEDLPPTYALSGRSESKFHLLLV